MAFIDKIGATDSINVGLGEAAGPSYPCPKCGKESKEHHLDEQERTRRICSAPTCRFMGLSREFMGMRS